ncbi:MAG: ankyrin repeat domain-containing protein [Candidatus Riflebacteria bacterium]|nr:ankyrin repeat domain-containing protein [Candidatus Riflebacteria bacterium]
MRFAGVLFLFWMLCFNTAAACVMQPSVWNQISSETKETTPSVYVLVEALTQFRTKMETEMRAGNVAFKQLCFKGVFDALSEQKIDLETYNNLLQAINVVWRDAQILPYDELLLSFEESYEETSFVGENNKYSVILVLSDSKTSLINMVDMNPQVYELLRFVVRDELKVFARASDSSGSAIFLDEFDVSPTLIVDPLLSPIGGFFIKFEKNTTYPIHIDFGTIGDDTEHVLRVNTGFHRPVGTPMFSEFRSELLNKIEKKEQNEKICNSLVFAIKSLDLEFFKIVIETYPDFDVNTKTNEGKTPLHYACEASAVEMVKTLLDLKADPTIKNNSGENALHAAMNIDPLCAAPTNAISDLTICPLTIPKMLIEAGVSVSDKTPQGNAPLHLAAKNGLVGVIGTLINAGAKVNELNNNEDTPLHVIGKIMSAPSAQVLLASGADKSLKNKQGMTPLDAAIKAVNAHLVNAINEYGKK